MNHLTALAGARVLAAEPPTLGTQQIITWTLRFVIPLIVLVAVVTIITRAAGGNQKTKDTMNTGTQIVLALVLLFSVGAIAALAPQISALFFGQS